MYIHPPEIIRRCREQHLEIYGICWYGVATISRMLKNIGLFCKRALQKRPVFCKETCIFKHPTHRSHPILTIHKPPKKKPHKGLFCKRALQKRPLFCKLKIRHISSRNWDSQNIEMEDHKTFLQRSKVVTLVLVYLSFSFTGFLLVNRSLL